jgi:hypothetical protein
MEGTVISDAVNLASRIEGLTKIYGVNIIVSEKVLTSISDFSKFNYRMIDNVVVKGKKNPIAIFEILDGYDEELCEKLIATKNDFELAVLSYMNKEFSKSLILMERVLEYNKIDVPAQLYIARCENAIKNGISDSFDGIEILTHK